MILGKGKCNCIQETAKKSSTWFRKSTDSDYSSARSCGKYRKSVKELKSRRKTHGRKHGLEARVSQITSSNPQDHYKSSQLVLPRAEAGSRPSSAPPRSTSICNDQDSIDSALDKVVAKVQEYHHTSFALEAMIYRDMVTFYAFITATNIFRIPAHVAEGRTVLDFFYYFREQNHLTQVQIETKALSLRVSVPDLSVATGNFTTGSSVAPSAKPRSSSGPSWALEIRKSKPEPSKQVRRSAYVPIRQMIVPPPPPRLFARDPQMISYKFHRYVVSIDPSNPTQVEFFLPQDTPIETISIAADWADGMEKAKQGLPFHQMGYIGSGSAKQVVYARAHIGDADDEYALGQSSDPGYLDHDHYLMLAQELRNLHFGEAMRKEFEELARDAQTPLSGKLMMTLQRSASIWKEPFSAACSYWTPTTPWWTSSAIDKPIQKFTGNNDCGNAPNDAMTTQLHSFSHFIGVYTGGDAMLWIYDRKKVMVLIDPQMHTGETRSENRMYWDNGPCAIELFLEHHLCVCSENSICNRLDLQQLRYEQPGDQDNSRPSTPPPQGTTRARSYSLSPEQEKKRQKGPIRAGTLTPLFTVEDFLRPNDLDRVSGGIGWGLNS
ncbi:hypothetical protein GGX14DRAFT_391058 [Mycena pura]|uniref:Alpha-type protein kinase domain-containing protein n=1 Tax=Mycena pura TaxID=153505 RepID=A0AAD6YFN3_9AGAR|nr:hypothetical protein GGX14DRAFT_391058 [Mycena pura]